MTKQETAKFVSAISGLYFVTVTPEAVALWHKALQNIPANHAEAALSIFQLKHPDASAPKPMDIFRYSRSMKFNFLGLSYKEAKARNHPVFQKIRRLDGRTAAYNPWATPVDADSEGWIDKDMERAYNDYISKCCTYSDEKLSTMQQRIDELKKSIDAPKPNLTFFQQQKQCSSEQTQVESTSGTVYSVMRRLTND